MFFSTPTLLLSPTHTPALSLFFIHLALLVLTLLVLKFLSLDIEFVSLSA